MVDTTNKGFEKPAYNSYTNTWDVPVNTNWDEIDSAFGGSTLLNSTGLSGDQTLAVASYRPLSLLISGTPTAAITYVVPSGVGGQWVVQNGTSGGYTVGIKSAAGGSTITVAATYQTIVSCDGTSTGMRLSISTPPTAAGSTTQIQFNSAGVLGGSAGLTWDGTTLGATGLNAAGNVALGATSGSTLTVYGTAVAIPNSLNIDSDTLFINSTTNLVGIGTASPTEKLTVAGSIKITTGGIKFSDGSVQTVAAGAGGAAGSSTWLQFNTSGGFDASSALYYTGGILYAPALTTTGAVSVGGGGGALSAGNTTITGTCTATAFSGSGALITNITVAGSNLTGTSLASGIVSSNLTSVGTLTVLSVSGAVTASSFSGSGAGLTGVTVAGSALTGTSLAGGITSSSLTSVGTLTSLSVSGTAYAAGGSGVSSSNYLASSGGTQLWNVTGGASIYWTGSEWYFNAPTNGRMRLSDSAFTIAATTSYNPSGTWTASSDGRLKENVRGRDGRTAMLSIASLRAVDYDWITPAEGRPKADRGFVAQEYRTVYPDDVVEMPNGYLGLAIGRAHIADLTAALKYLWEAFEAYKATHP